MKNADYTLYKALPGVPVERATERVIERLKEQGFGVLTTIDVRETLRDRIGVDHKPYVILGACNPHLANEALSIDDNVGVMLPCNVVVAATDDGSEVAIARPDSMMAATGSRALVDIASEAQMRMEAVIAGI